MIGRLYEIARSWVREFRKDVDALLDRATPHGWVEIRLIDRGTEKIHHSERLPMQVPVLGRNVVTGFVGGPPYSGRDLMRRLIVPSTFAGSLTGDDYLIGNIELGSSTQAETSSDSSLVAAISGSMKEISEVEFDATNPYVTFVAQWDESEVNQAISEAGLRSNDETHLWARKTFTSFTKSSLFIMQIRWTIRF
jgi:hypothetical protein